MKTSLNGVFFNQQTGVTGIFEQNKKKGLIKSNNDLVVEESFNIDLGPSNSAPI